MRGFPRRHMCRLAAPIMIGADAALGTALRAEGAPAPFYPWAFGHRNGPDARLHVSRLIALRRPRWGTALPRTAVAG
jgi:hypothetical protein